MELVEYIYSLRRVLISEYESIDRFFTFNALIYRSRGGEGAFKVIKREVKKRFKSLKVAKNRFKKSMKKLQKVTKNQEYIFHLKLLTAYRRVVLINSLINLRVTSDFFDYIDEVLSKSLDAKMVDTELKRIEKRIESFNQELLKSHKNILNNIFQMERGYKK